MISVNVPGGVANFPDGTTPDVIKAALRKKFPPPAAAPSGQDSSLIRFPNGSGNTPTSAAVMQMAPNNGAPAPAAAGASLPSPQPAAQPSTPSVAPQATPQQPTAPQGQPSSGNWLVDAANVMSAGLRGNFEPLMDNPTALGNTASFLNNLGSAASFGVAPAIQRTINNAISPGSGDRAQANIDATNEANPAGAVAGAAAAIPVDMMLTAPLGGIGAEGSLAANLARGGGAVGNVARAAAGGAAGAGINAYADTGDLATAATAAGVGAVAGPIFGKVAGAAAGATKAVMAGPTRKAWAYIAQKIGVPAADLTKFVQAHTALTGQAPSIQQVLDSHAAGAVKNFAESNPETAMLLQKGQAATEQALPSQATAVVEKAGIAPPAPDLLSTVPATRQTPLALKQHLDANFTAAMDPIRDQPVTLPMNLFGKRRVFSSLPQDVKDTIQKSMIANPDAKTVELPLGVADNLRQVWGGLSRGTGKDRQYFYDRGATLAHALTNQNGDLGQHYGDLLSKYGEADRYRLGFNHAFNGGAAVDTATGKTAKAVATPEGAAGHAAGVSTSFRNQAASSPTGAAATLHQIASEGSDQRAFGNAVAAQPGSGPALNAKTDKAIAASQAHLDALKSAHASTPQALRPADESANSRNILAAAGEAAVGLHLSATGRMARVTTDLLRMSKFSPSVQRTIGKGLTSHDSREVAHTIDLLRHMQVDQATFKRLQNAAAAVFGGTVGQSLVGHGG